MMRAWITAAASTIGSVAFQMSVDAGYLHNFKWAIPWAWALSVGLWAFLATSYPPVREKWFKRFHDFMGGWIHVIRIPLCVLVFAFVGVALRHAMKEKPVDVPAQTVSAPTQPAPNSSSTEASQQSESPKPPPKKSKPAPKTARTTSTTVGGDVNQSSSGNCSPNNVANGNTTNCPPPMPSPESSLIHQSGGKMDDTEIVGSTVAPPVGGGATLVKQDNGEMSGTKIEDSHVLGTPSTLPATSPSPVTMGHSLRGAFIDNEVCGFSSGLNSTGDNEGNLVKGLTVNGPSCDWHSFLDVVRTHRSDMSDFLAKWETTMLKSWSSLPQEKVDSNRKELEAIQKQLIEGAQDDDKFNAVLNQLYKNIPSFDVKVPD